MPSKSGILLVTRAPETERAAASALETSPRLELAGVCPGLPELVSRLEVEPAGPAGIPYFGKSVDLLDDRLVVASDLGAHVFELRASPVRQAPERLPR